MTTREKIIVGLMCLTILYGAFELFGNKSNKSNKSNKIVKSTNPAKELKDFAESVTKKLIDEKVSDEYRYLITQAANEWNKDPFIHSITPLRKQLLLPSMPQKPTGDSLTQNYIYTGYLKLGSKKLAVINGREYAEGESFNTKGLYIKYIYPNKVVIAKVNGPETIQLPLTESGPAIGEQ